MLNLDFCRTEYSKLGPQKHSQTWKNTQEIASKQAVT